MSQHETRRAAAIRVTPPTGHERLQRIIASGALSQLAQNLGMLPVGAIPTVAPGRVDVAVGPTRLFDRASTLDHLAPSFAPGPFVRPKLEALVAVTVLGVSPTRLASWCAPLREARTASEAKLAAAGLINAAFTAQLADHCAAATAELGYSVEVTPLPGGVTEIVGSLPSGRGLISYVRAGKDGAPIVESEVAGRGDCAAVMDHFDVALARLGVTLEDVQRKPTGGVAVLPWAARLRPRRLDGTGAASGSSGGAEEQAARSRLNERDNG